ncbi:type II toxin-antitoxin system HicA family toxin [Massilia sp. MB5]|uniref:type II toxin-antitoxin system HicA family toxin n=1 Tax=unclassified Massilia TaxID=2609279 RepID=UPI0009E47624|nr:MULTISPECIES: type II toxin-antitoxin system HicA family toxin [unclassified Massilia]UMR33004.1 type II toxin-antitoxin system HicA family toxin [Massilia sp. MB5]
MNSKTLIDMLKADGWQLVRIRGSHHHFRHPGKNGLITVPHPKKDLPAGTWRRILHDAGLR